MGKLSQLFCFLNAEEVPNAQQMRHHYSHIDKTPELMKLRREYRKDLAKNVKQKEKKP